MLASLAMAIVSTSLTRELFVEAVEVSAPIADDEREGIRQRARANREAVERSLVGAMSYAVTETDSPVLVATFRSSRLYELLQPVVALAVYPATFGVFHLRGVDVSIRNGVSLGAFMGALWASAIAVILLLANRLFVWLDVRSRPFARSDVMLKGLRDAASRSPCRSGP